MIILYNALQLLLFPLLAPVLLLTALVHAKYRRRTPSRLGFGVAKALQGHPPGQPTFWVHALSVGETTSAIPLLKGIRATWPECRIVFSVTTRSGRRVADSTLGGLVDTVIDSPFDLLPVVLHFCNHIRPECYILVETDFWPNDGAVCRHCLSTAGYPMKPSQATGNWRFSSPRCLPTFRR